MFELKGSELRLKKTFDAKVAQNCKKLAVFVHLKEEENLPKTYEKILLSVLFEMKLFFNHLALKSYL